MYIYIYGIRSPHTHRYTNRLIGLAASQNPGSQPLRLEPNFVAETSAKRQRNRSPHPLSGAQQFCLLVYIILITLMNQRLAI